MAKNSILLKFTDTKQFTLRTLCPLSLSSKKKINDIVLEMYSIVFWQKRGKQEET